MGTGGFIAFVQGFLFSLSLCFDLGLVNIAIIKTGMERGLKPSFLIGFGSCFGDLTYLLLALLGVTFIFQISAVRCMLWIAGTAVLLFLAYRMLRDAIQPKAPDASRVTVTNRSSFQDILFGAGIALSSPTSILWFAVVAGPILTTIDITQSIVLYLFIVGFFAAGLMWSFGLAMLSSQTGRLMGMKLVRVISLLSACLFLYFALKVFVDGFKHLGM